MQLDLFQKYQLANIIIEEVHRVEYPSDVLKLEMKEFFKPKDKREQALLFGSFSKYHHGKIRDAFSVCQKGWKHTEEPKYKSLLYLVAIIKNIK